MIYDVIIVGAGLAGCSAAIQLADRGWKVLLLEQQRYPTHKLCGEFLSVEVMASFAQLGILAAVQQIGAHPIQRALLTSSAGAQFTHRLPGVALGLSRYRLDLLLFERAIAAGATALDGAMVRAISGDATTGFTVTTSQGNFTGRMVLAAYGKRSRLDHDRAFVQRRSPWVAFKAHCTGLELPGVIELHGFAGGYCGLSMIETGQVNLCWIGHERVLYSSDDRQLPEALWANPVLADRLRQVQFDPAVRNHLGQISLALKGNFMGDICMIGDTVGMITPLCGDGMAMALRTAEIVVPLADRYLGGQNDFPAFQRGYTQAWRREFQLRLGLGRVMHSAFIRPSIAQASITVCQQFPTVGHWLIRHTRGEAEALPA